MKNETFDQVWDHVAHLPRERRKRLLDDPIADDFHAPPDALELCAAGRAACGHCALAALLGWSVEKVLPAFDGYALWTSERTMIEVMQRLHLDPKQARNHWPEKRAVVWLQGIGSWMKPGIPLGARNQRTHWIAQDEAGEVIYDANIGQWVSRAVWEQTIAVQLKQRWKAISIEPRSTLIL